MSKMGDILIELEEVLDKMIDQGLQTGDVMDLVFGHIVRHRPDAFEEYEDNSEPVYVYKYTRKF